MKKLVLVTIFCLMTLAINTDARAAGYSFMAGAADGCGMGGIHFYGYGGLLDNGTYYWSTYINPSLYQSGPNAYLAYSWQMYDQAGLLASGSFDSRTNTSVNGTYSSGSNFYTVPPTGPVENMSFQASGSYYSPYGGYGGTPCNQSFYATTFTTSGSGGYFNYNP
jgi:hypothetical protein